MTEVDQFDEMVARTRGLPPADAARQVREFFRSLSGEAPWNLAERRRDEVGALHGAPAKFRYRANAIRLIAGRYALEGELVSGKGSRRQERSRWAALEHLTTPLARQVQGSDYRPERIEYQRQLLDLDPGGHGPVIEVHGLLDWAPDVAVVVPDMGRSPDDLRAQLDWAEEFHKQSGDGTATVLWAGHNALGAPAPGSKHAAAGADADAVAALLRFRAGLDTEMSPGASVAMIGQGHGSVLIGQAAAEGLRFDRLIINDSPGRGWDASAAAGLAWSGRAATSDPARRAYDGVAPMRGVTLSPTAATAGNDQSRRPATQSRLKGPEGTAR
jgi:hypothetical protein